MPNLLGHFGVQALATHAVIPRVEPRWVVLGCIIPDVPWILSRALTMVSLPLSPYDLRAYAIVQASLMFSLVLAWACASFLRHRGHVFATLALGAGLHLLLDALQTKWGNGVHLAAPLSWRIQSFDLFWPESIVTIALSLAGVAYAVRAWRTTWTRRSVGLTFARPWLGVAALILYFALPPAFIGAVERSDSHDLETLREVSARPGRPIELDRVAFVRQGDSVVIRTFAAEELRIVGWTPSPSRGTVSVRGRFLDSATIAVDDAHTHAGWARDLASYLALLYALALWGAGAVPADLLGRRGVRSHDRTV